jgi:hypothetical protein
MELDAADFLAAAAVAAHEGTPPAVSLPHLPADRGRNPAPALAGLGGRPRPLRQSRLPRERSIEQLADRPLDDRGRVDPRHERLQRPSTL